MLGKARATLSWYRILRSRCSDNGRQPSCPKIDDYLWLCGMRQPEPIVLSLTGVPVPHHASPPGQGAHNRVPPQHMHTISSVFHSVTPPYHSTPIPCACVHCALMRGTEQSHGSHIVHRRHQGKEHLPSYLGHHSSEAIPSTVQSSSSS